MTHQIKDPTIVHGAECPRCLNWQHDTELDFAPSGDCWECADADENDDAPEPDGFFSVARDILSARWPL